MSIIKLCKKTDFNENTCFRAQHPLDNSKSIVIIQNEDSFYAYENICPHFSVQMDYKKGVFNTYQNQWLMCAHHSAMFEITTGECVDGPCKGHSLTPVSIEIDEGHIYFIR